ncbi:MAG: hypothetical protein AAF530_21275 [Pseudomonadota bacterium]
MTFSSSTSKPDTIVLMKRAHDLRSAAIAHFFGKLFRTPKAIAAECRLRPHADHVPHSAAS